MNTDIEHARMDVFIWASIWREATSREMLAFCVMKALNNSTYAVWRLIIMYYCIVNPGARSGRGGDTWARLEERLREEKKDYEAVYTTGPGDALYSVRHVTSEYDREEKLGIVVLGGDGTLNEVVSGITDPSKVLVGFLPVGSGNDFCRDQDYPVNRDEQIERVLSFRERRRLDIGTLTYNSTGGKRSKLAAAEFEKTRRFDVSCGLGFDAAVCAESQSSNAKGVLNRIGLGKLTYGFIGVKNLANAPKFPCELEITNELTGTHEKLHFPRFLFVSAMIHRYEGGGFKFAPGADFTDGLFDMCIVGDMPVPKMFVALPPAYFGHHYGFKGVYHRLATSVRIRTKEPVWVHTDGEVLTQADDITLTCQKQALAFMT